MKRITYLFLATILWSSCQTPSSKKTEVEYHSYIHGLASPIKMSLSNTKIVLTDYFEDLGEIDKIEFEDVLYRPDSAGILTLPNNCSAPIGNLRVIYKNAVHDIPVFASEKVNYTFKYKPTSPSVSEVSIAGSMNGWNRKASPLTKNGEEWTIDLELNPGLYEYRIWEGEKETMDRNNQDVKDNGMGAFNNTFFAGSEKYKEAVAPQIFTQSATENSITLSTTGGVNHVLAYFQNEQIPATINGENITINIPAVAKNFDRSFIRVYADNLIMRANDILVPLTHSDVVINATSLDRHDLQASIMYFAMLDRFVDGDTTNDRPTPDPAIISKANNFGGDIAGITQKIKDGYFDKLGVNTIWISPISQNAEGAWGLWTKGVTTKFSAYHGYWPTALTRIDNRFGNDAQFKEMIEVAHAHGMNVLLDYVAHHVHQDHPLYKQKPEWTTPLYLPDGTMNTEKWDEHRLTTWFDTFLPTWDFSKPEVIDALTDTAMYWVNHYDLDGFRHDATKHIPEAFWRSLTTKVKKSMVDKPDRNIFQIGETYGNPELIGSYISSGQMDAQFDFNLYDAAVDAFAKDRTDFANLQRVIKQSATAYGSHHLMGNITGNQDRARFASYADGSVDFAEDPKLAGYVRDIQTKGTRGLDRMAQLNALIMSLPGIPCIYYGDEIGMPGANDPDNRRMMTFAGWNARQQQLHDEVAALVKLRREHLALTYGDLIFVGETPTSLCYARNYFGKTAIILFAKGDNKEMTFTLPASVQSKGLKALSGSTFSVDGNQLKVTVKGGYEVLFN